MAGKAVVEATDAAEEEEALVSELGSVELGLVQALKADAEKKADLAATAEVTDQRPKVMTRDAVDHLATEMTATRRAAAEERTTKEEEEADLVTAAEELTSTERDQEETDREVAEEEAPEALAQDLEPREVVPRPEPQSPSEHLSPEVRQRHDSEAI